MEGEWEIYNRFLAGDESALEQIIGKYKDGLILYLNSFVKDLSAAEELTEETFVKLVLRKPRFLKKSGFKTWLFAIARNAALDSLRKGTLAASLEQIGPICDEEADLERGYIQRETKIRLHRVMRSLKPEYQQVLWLVYFEGFSLREVGTIMKKSTHNTETLVYRARNALKAKLLKEGFVYEDL